MGLVLAAILFLASTALSDGFPAHRSFNPSVFIINPNYTAISKYNYTVAVLKDGELLGGGVLFKPKWVLTAAYNTDGFKASQLTVRVDSNSATSGGHLLKVSKITQHPKYSGNWTYDLAVLKLSSAVGSKVAKQVSALSTKAFSGEAAVVLTGYGATSSSGVKKISQNLRKVSTTGLQVVDIQVYDYTTCNKIWYGNELVKGQICGYSPGVGPCWSDFGDPVVECVAGVCTLVGIFSGSYGCADDHYPGIYLDIGAFYTWIKSIIK